MPTYSVDISDFEHFDNGLAFTLEGLGSGLGGGYSGKIYYANPGSAVTHNFLASTTGAGAGSLGQTSAMSTIHVNPRMLPSNTVNKFICLTAMQSARDITGGSGTAYCAYINSHSTTPKIGVSKLTAGLNTISSESLTEDDYTTTEDTPFYFKFAWNYISGTPETTLKVWAGPSLAMLTLYIDTTDTTSPYSTSVGESVAAAVGASPGTGEWLLDNWDLAL